MKHMVISEKYNDDNNNNNNNNDDNTITHMKYIP